MALGLQLSCWDKRSYREATVGVFSCPSSARFYHFPAGDAPEAQQCDEQEQLLDPAEN